MFLINPYIYGGGEQHTYLADDYAFDAVFSLYKESTTATNCMRIRRDSDNAELDIGFVDDFFDQSAISTFCGLAQGWVVTWYDQKNSNNITQSTAADQPNVKYGGGVRNNIRFEINEKSLNLGSAITSLGTPPFSFFAPYAAVTTNVFQGLFTTSSVAASLIVFADTTTAKTKSFRVYNGSTDYPVSAPSAIPTSTVTLLSGFIDASKNMSVFNNGVAGTTNTYTGTYLNDDFRIGTNETNSRDFVGGSYGVYVSGSDLSADRTTIEAVINSRLSIYDLSYLVDAYSPAAAYSNQKISSTTTNVMRVRRASDNAEIDASASDLTDGTLLAWVGAPSTAYVVKWYDQSGNGNHLTQSTAAQQPLIVQGGVLSQGMKFDGINDFLSLGSGLSALTAEPFSYCSVHRSEITAYSSVFLTALTSADRTQAYTGTNGGVNAGFLVRNTASSVYLLNLTTAVPINTETLLTGIADSSKGMSGFRDGASAYATDTFTGTLQNDDFLVGGGNSTVGAYVQGQIRELIIFGTDETSNRTDIETNINDRYSIY